MSRDSLAQFRQKHLGFVFQEFNLQDSLSLKENVMLPLIMDGRAEEEMQQKADSIMSMFDIKSIYLHQLFPFSLYKARFGAGGNYFHGNFNTYRQFRKH